MRILNKILRMGEGRILKQLAAIADQVNALEETVSGLTDAELRAETDQFKERLAAGETIALRRVEPTDESLESVFRYLVDGG